MKLYFEILAILGFLSLLLVVPFFYEEKTIKTIAIANWGEHPSLLQTIQGIKEGLKKAGYTEGVDIVYKELHADFKREEIAPMIRKLQSFHPDLFVAISTPVAKELKEKVSDTPIVFTDVTDPVDAGLLEDEFRAQKNLTGVSEKKNFDRFLDLIMKIFPEAESIGMLFSTADPNDRRLLKLMESAAAHHSFEVYPVPVLNKKDMSVRLEKFRDRVDLIYVGMHGLPNASLERIAEEVDLMGIPLFSMETDLVKQHKLFGAFAINYHRIGMHTAKLVSSILQGEEAYNIRPVFPKSEDHIASLSLRKARALGVLLPDRLRYATVLD